MELIVEIFAVVDSFCYDSSGGSYSGVISCSDGTECRDAAETLNVYLSIPSGRESVVQFHFSQFHIGRMVNSKQCSSPSGYLRMIEWKSDVERFFCGDWTGLWYQTKVTGNVALSVKKPKKGFGQGSLNITYSGEVRSQSVILQ